MTLTKYDSIIKRQICRSVHVLAAVICALITINCEYKLLTAMTLVTKVEQFTPVNYECNEISWLEATAAYLTTVIMFITLAIELKPIKKFCSTFMHLLCSLF